MARVSARSIALTRARRLTTPDRRDLRLIVAAPGAQMRLGISSARLVAWSLAAPPEATLELHGQRLIHLEGLGERGDRLGGFG